MQKALEKISLLILFIALTFLMVGCGVDMPKEKLAPVTKSATFDDEYYAQDTWLIYWYLCGTDLETEGRRQLTPKK